MKVETNELVRQPKNFCHYPLYFPSSKGMKNEDGLTCFDNGEGFKVEMAIVPKQFDYVVLLQLMKQVQSIGYKEKIRTTRHNLMKMCGIDRCGHNYKRLKRALNTWLHTVCHYENSWCVDGTIYSSVHYNVLSSWKPIEGSNEVEVSFTSEFIETIKESSFYHYIEIPEIKKLGSQIASRLYEMLKAFTPRKKTWSIDVFKLAAKIPIHNAKYVSKIIPRLKSAIKQINDNTSLSVKMNIRKKGTNKAMAKFVFQVVKKKKPEKEIENKQVIEKIENEEKQTLMDNGDLYDMIILMRNKLKESKIPHTERKGIQEYLLEKIMGGFCHNGSGGYDPEIILLKLQEIERRFI